MSGRRPVDAILKTILDQDNNYIAQGGENIYCFTLVKLLWSLGCLYR